MGGARLCRRPAAATWLAKGAWSKAALPDKTHFMALTNPVPKVATAGSPLLDVLLKGGG